MKIGISGSVGIGKTWFVEELNNSIFLRVEEAARKVNAMYPDKNINDTQLLERTLSDSFRKKTLGEFAEIGRFMEFNKRFKDVFLKTAGELCMPVEIIFADYDVFSLNNRNQMLQEKIINNFLGV